MRENNLQEQIDALKQELDKYIKSGFWSRRDVVKGGFGLLGIGALAGIAKGDTQITDSAVTVGGNTLLHTGDKNVANGIAGVDANARIANAQVNSPTPTQPARVKDTVYQNALTRPLFVHVSGYAPAGQSFYTDIGSANPPTTVISWAQNAGYFSSAFFVPPDWYYRIRNPEGAASTPAYWTEW